MKKLLTILCGCFFLSSAASAAVEDGINKTSCDNYAPEIKACTIHWANDTGTDIGPTLVSLPSGLIVGWRTVPDGTNAPTAAYDVKVLKDNDATTGEELIENMDNLSATASEGAPPLKGGAYGGVPTDGTMYVYVSGLTNANDDEGDIILYIKVK